MRGGRNGPKLAASWLRSPRGTCCPRGKVQGQAEVFVWPSRALRRLLSSGQRKRRVSARRGIVTLPNAPPEHRPAAPVASLPPPALHRALENTTVPLLPVNTTALTGPSPGRGAQERLYFPRVVLRGDWPALGWRRLLSFPFTCRLPPPSSLPEGFSLWVQSVPA